MDAEHYKVGWTTGTAEERAEQLSSATGVTLSFVVVEQWQNAQADVLEKRVHAMLAPYRVKTVASSFAVTISL